MNRRFAPILLPILLALLSLAVLAPGRCLAGAKAAEVRQQNGLLPFEPGKAFLDGDFLAQEKDPGFVFGSVAAFVASRSCPTAWLIEEGEKARLASVNLGADPVEYTLYLEEDCPAAARAYAFVVQSSQDAKQWLAWRKNFHKSKADGYYGETLARLEKAASQGVTPAAELRFVLTDGELGLTPPEDFLIKTLKFAPKFDLKTGQPTGK
jgi:hypothetical protein